VTGDRPDPAALFLALADCLQRDELPPPAVRDWLTRGVRGWLFGIPLDEALGLAPDEASYTERDEHLRAAARCVGNSATELLREIGAAQQGLNRDSNAARHVVAAIATGRKMPTSERQLRRILNGSRTSQPATGG